jgi:hypothetical protein
MTTQEILTNIKSLVETIELEGSKTSKAAHGRARKAASELKKLAGEYKKVSLVESKN